MATGVRVLLALLAAAAQPGCDRDPTGGSVEGPALYGQLCVACHGATGKPSAAMAQQLGVRDLTEPGVRARLTQVRVAEQIAKGSQNKLMPSFAGLVTPAQIDALAAYVVSPAFLAPPSPPSP